MQYKLAFFDIDGTLSVPNYYINGEHKTGMTNEEWLLYTMDINAYSSCAAPKIVRDYIIDLMDKGVEIYVITQESWSPAFKAKCEFVRILYPEIKQSNIHYVIKKENKPNLIEMIRLCQEKPTDMDECLYYDDDYEMVLIMNNLGYDAHHVSEFLK